MEKGWIKRELKKERSRLDEDEKNAGRSQETGRRRLCGKGWIGAKKRIRGKKRRQREEMAVRIREWEKWRRCEELELVGRRGVPNNSTQTIFR